MPDGGGLYGNAYGFIIEDEVVIEPGMGVYDGVLPLAPGMGVVI